MTFPIGIIKTDYINTTDSTVNKVEEEKNCGCGQDPCETYGVKTKSSNRGRSRSRRAKKSKANPSTSDCEWRKAPDGEWYTKSMFYDHYEGYDEWEQAQYVSSLEKELKRGDYEKAQYIESLEKKLKLRQRDRAVFVISAQRWSSGRSRDRGRSSPVANNLENYPRHPELAQAATQLRLS